MIIIIIHIYVLNTFLFHDRACVLALIFRAGAPTNVVSRMICTLFISTDTACNSIMQSTWSTALGSRP